MSRTRDEASTAAAAAVANATNCELRGHAADFIGRQQARRTWTDRTGYARTMHNC